METLQAFLNWSVYGIPAFLLLITVVVFFHELGHYTVARLFNVRVETFSIGFGRAITSWTGKESGTRWKIGWIPLGGYVQFLGDADGASTPDREAAARMTPEERAVAFPFKPLWQRALIVLAGPVTNFILAVVILTGVYMVQGQTILPPVVGLIVPHSAAEAAGFKINDRIVSIDGVPVRGYREVVEVVSMSAGMRLPIVVERGDAHLLLYATPRETVDDDGLGNKVHVGKLGIGPGKVEPIHDSLGPIAAVGASFREIGDTLTMTWRGLTHSSAGAGQLSGIIGTTKLAGQVAAVSFVGLIHLIALLSVSVGLVNLFPIPLLDGGHLLYYACEGVLGRPLGERAQDVGFRLGLAVVLGIFLLAAWNDIVRLNLF
ncbi:MAG: site-2 protease family protein [Proteobacteria bacterium]|nr:site-2 protease family protein [Pseudomonadota bacterium]